MTQSKIYVHDEKSNLHVSGWFFFNLESSFYQVEKEYFPNLFSRHRSKNESLILNVN